MDIKFVRASRRWHMKGAYSTFIQNRIVTPASSWRHNYRDLNNSRYINSGPIALTSNVKAFTDTSAHQRWSVEGFKEARDLMATIARNIYVYSIYTHTHIYTYIYLLYSGYSERES